MEKHRKKPITSREKEILRLLCSGESSKNIALVSGISASTVESHKKNLMNKLNAKNIVELVYIAHVKGLVV